MSSTVRMGKPGWSAAILPNPDPHKAVASSSRNDFKVVHSSNEMEVSVKLLERPQSALPGSGTRASPTSESRGGAVPRVASATTRSGGGGGGVRSRKGKGSGKGKGKGGGKKTLAVADEQIRTLQKLGEDFARKTHEIKDKMEEMADEELVLEKEIVKYRKSMGGNEVGLPVGGRSCLPAHCCAVVRVRARVSGPARTNVAHAFRFSTTLGTQGYVVVQFSRTCTCAFLRPCRFADPPPPSHQQYVSADNNRFVGHQTHIMENRLLHIKRKTMEVGSGIKQLKVQINQLRHEKMLHRANCERVAEEIQEAVAEQLIWRRKSDEKARLLQETKKEIKKEKREHKSRQRALRKRWQQLGTELDKEELKEEDIFLPENLGKLDVEDEAQLKKQ